VKVAPSSGITNLTGSPFSGAAFVTPKGM
jgi:hypothetical protein